MKVTALAKVRLLLTAALVIPVLVLSGMVLVHAQEEPDSDDTTETTETADQKKNLEERLAERKAALEQKLSTAQKNRLKARCKSAQGLLQSAEARIKGVETRRLNAYEKLVTRLGELSTKLEAEAVDTAELDSQLSELQTKIDAFKEQITEYRQAVVDLGDMDCEADPEGFKASLEAARTSRAEAAQTSKALHEYVLGTIKETLKDIKAQLHGTDNGGEGETNGQE